MKRLLKKILPGRFLQWYKIRNRRYFKFRNMSVNNVFEEIYNKNHWNSLESISGGGSELIQTGTLVKQLEKLFNDMNFISILDIPCGDFNWMQKVNLSGIDYIGADIVEELVKNNRKKYEKNNLSFQVLNLITDPLPKSDIIIVRDCLVHLSYSNIFDVIKNIKSSGCKYILTTTYTNHNLNLDIITGDWRTLNLEKKPFNFPGPILIINENSTEGKGEYKDKSMALWEISKI